MTSLITDIDRNQKKFLEDEFFNCTIRGAILRGYVYDDEKTVTRVERENLRERLRSSLERLIPSYRAGVSEEDHIQNIDELSKKISEKHAGVLKNKRFRVGTAQKALNLYLKYFWCVGMVPLPPHCPFDNGVIKKLKSLPSDRKWSWTQLDAIEDYKALVAAAKVEADGASLAEWELQLCNDSYGSPT